MSPIRPADLDAPWHEDTLLQLRTSRMKPMLNLTVQTGIYKEPRASRVFCSLTGLDSDEHDLTFHGGAEKAVHQYFPGHYPLWRAEFSSAERVDAFVPGGFGENLVSERMNERNVCIGDKVRVGEVLLQVCLPRQPCFKLNHRFGVKGFARKTWEKSRTGWYYRVLEEGTMGVGDKITLVERMYPKWTIERIQEFVFRQEGRIDMLQELAQIPEFGAEMKHGLKQKIHQYEVALSAKDNPKEPEKWEPFILISKKAQTPHITSFTFSKASSAAEEGEGEELDPGVFARLKLPSGLIRPYSIVSGTANKFTLGIKLESLSRGGSSYLHNDLAEGDTVLVGKITESVPIKEQASNHIFIAGGIGITAFLMHAEIYGKISFNYSLYFAVSSESDVPFKEELADLEEGRVKIYDKTKGQRMNIELILKERPWNSYIYVCGPQRMISDIIATSAYLGISKDEIHIEAFETEKGGDPFTIELKGTGKVLQVGEDQTLLGVLRQAGLEVDSSCETGNCGTCRVTVCEGVVQHRGSGLEEEWKGREMLSCVSRGVGRLVIDV